MSRMMRKKKRFGRCSVQGHGHHCCVAQERQGHEVTRTEDKREGKEFIEEELNEMEDVIVIETMEQLMELVDNTEFEVDDTLSKMYPGVIRVFEEEEC